MITKLCDIIADFFIKEKIISEEQREVYHYGIELCVSSVIGILLLIIVGVISGRIIECAVFYIVFCFTRLYCGGFHANSHLKCQVVFITTLIMILVIDYLICGIPEYYWFILYAYSLIVIASIAPIENPNKPLSFKEKKRGRLISIIVMIIWLIVMVIMILLHSNLYHIIALTLFFVATLMLFGKYYKGRRDNNEN